LRYGLDELFSRWELVQDFRRDMQRWVWDLPENMPSLTAPTKMRLMLQELGPTYVKVGQIISSQASVIPQEWAVELEKLQSNVAPFPSDQVREIIIEELGKPPEELYATFEVTPFAAASTAQVHRATLHDGTKVAVKVQRPHIRPQMKADIGIMENAARVVSARSRQARSVDLVGMVEQFGTSALRELDYTGEAYNAYKLTRNMVGLPGVHIPVVYSDLSTTKVLTMEFVRGVKISNLDAIDQAGIDRTELATNTLRAMIKQLLIDGFFHADPHPGNLLVNLTTGDVSFIDTGMVGELDFNQRVNLIQLLIAIQQQDVDGMAHVMFNLSQPFLPKIDEKAYYKDFERSIGRYVFGGARADFGQMVGVMFELLRRHGLRLDPNLTLAIKALMQAEAVATLLFPEGGIMEVGVPMVRDLAIQEVTAERLLDLAMKQVTVTARELFKRLPDLTTASLSWLDQYQQGRLQVYVDTSSLAEPINKIGRLGRQVVLALLLVGMVIGSAIAASFSAVTGTLWANLPVIAYIGYIFSVSVTALVVIRLVWRWIRGRDPGGD
jgi:ubiquinone biosynthesis protein